MNSRLDGATACVVSMGITFPAVRGGMYDAGRRDLPLGAVLVSSRSLAAAFDDAAEVYGRNECAPPDFAEADLALGGQLIKPRFR